jgi:hypothetical protein
VYFALLQESAVPARLSLGAIAGCLFDAEAGAAGHRHDFIMLALIAIIGLAAKALLLRRRTLASAA